MDLETKMVALEMRWREADDLLRAARAELASNLELSTVVADALRKKINYAESKKISITREIVALEEQMDFSV
jgi:hypothetical protein